MGSACAAGPLVSSIAGESWTGVAFSDESSSPALTGCGELGFAPTIEARPETAAADTATGLRFDLHVPQKDKVGELATADLKNAVVTLPEGMTLNPSAANGRAACPLLTGEAGAKGEKGINLQSSEPANCPDASKIGTVEVTTPLLEKPLPGSIYLAAQQANPFGSLLAIYLAVEDPPDCGQPGQPRCTGVRVKLAGHVEPNPETGRLTTTFADNPQLPFEDFKLRFFGGPRGPLTTPPTCGTQTTSTALTPWSSETPATPSSSFKLAEGPGGSACPSTVAEEPNRPSFEAGTLTPTAGAFSPFVLHLYHEYDGSQPLKALDVTLPPGLTGRLAGIAQCPQAGIEQAEGRSGEGQGKLEQEDPSCPASSEVGTVTVGAGSGTPIYVSGHAYLAGPYAGAPGAPFSVAIVTPAIAGPFDLGTVVVRAGLYINPETAQATVKSTLPTILHGVPLDIRSITVDTSRRASP